jgi:hypothetical protein
LLGKNWLKGELGDTMHANLCGAGHTPRLILAHLRVLLLASLAAHLECLRSARRLPQLDQPGCSRPTT